MWTRNLLFRSDLLVQCTYGITNTMSKCISLTLDHQNFLDFEVDKLYEWNKVFKFSIWFCGKWQLRTDVLCKCSVTIQRDSVESPSESELFHFHGEFSENVGKTVQSPPPLEIRTPWPIPKTKVLNASVIVPTSFLPLFDINTKYVSDIKFETHTHTKKKENMSTCFKFLISENMPSSDCLENRFGNSCLRRNNNLNVMIGILFLSGVFILIEQSLSETIVVRHHKMNPVMKNMTLALKHVRLSSYEK